MSIFHLFAGNFFVEQIKLFLEKNVLLEGALFFDLENKTSLTRKSGKMHLSKVAPFWLKFQQKSSSESSPQYQIVTFFSKSIYFGNSSIHRCSGSNKSFFFVMSWG